METNFDILHAIFVALEFDILNFLENLLVATIANQLGQIQFCLGQGLTLSRL